MHKGPLTLVVNSELHLTLVSEEKALFTLMFSGEISPTLVSVEKVPLRLVKCPLTVISGEGSPYIDGQW